MNSVLCRIKNQEPCISEVQVNSLVIEFRPGTLEVRGDIDASNASELRAALLAAPRGPLCVDLASVDFMDVSAVRALLEARHARYDDGFAIIAISRRVHRIMELCDVLHVLDIVGADPGSLRHPD